MKKYIVISILFVFLFSMITVSASSNTANVSLASTKNSVEVGEEFDIILWLDTNFETTGFTLRQMVWESDLAEGIPDSSGTPGRDYNVTFSDDWGGKDNPFLDDGDLYPGNLTYTMCNNLSGLNGSYPVFTIHFKALKEGTLHINIPDAIDFGTAKGQPGVEIAFADITNWDEKVITIGNPEDDDDNNGGPNPPPPPPPDDDDDEEPPVDDDDDEEPVDDNDTEPPENILPVAVINCPVNGTVNESIYFDSVGSYDEDGEILEYIWDFDTGVKKYLTETNYTFTESGEYTVKLTVVDNNGSENSSSCLVSIESVEEEPEPEPEPEPEEIEEVNVIHMIATIIVFAVFLTVAIYVLFIRRLRGYRK